MEHLTWHSDREWFLVRGFGYWNGMLEERVSARCWVLRDRNRFDLLRGVGWGLGLLDLLLFLALAGDGLRYRPYFENYTVDASILQLIIDQLHKMILKIISQFQTHTFGCGSSF